MRIIHLAQEEKPEYMLEHGILYDEDADDVFSIKDLTRFKVPLFKSPKEANAFLEQLEIKTKRSFGRVPEKDFIHEVRYKDTGKEREEARRLDMEERNQRWKHGEF